MILQEFKVPYYQKEEKEKENYGPEDKQELLHNDSNRVENLEKFKNLKTLKGGKLEYSRIARARSRLSINLRGSYKAYRTLRNPMHRAQKIAEDVAYRIVYHTRDFFWLLLLLAFRNRFRIARDTRRQLSKNKKRKK